MTKRPNDSSPRCSANARSPTSIAEAPLLRPGALPAVIVPSGRTAGRSFARVACVVSTGRVFIPHEKYGRLACHFFNWNDLSRKALGPGCAQTAAANAPPDDPGRPGQRALIRGWANYYRHAVSKRIFNRASWAIWQCLWRWARRRHLNKGARWVRQKYFRSVGARHWVFRTVTGRTLSTGKPELLTLHDITSTQIQRHRKIKGAANPFDPQWESDFEERSRVAMLDSLKGRMRLIRLWLSQERVCPVCGQMIMKSSRWRLFHLERVADGGTDASSNLVMMHPDCHTIARGRRFPVVKPAPATGL
jgi:hypothetical protein